MQRKFKISLTSHEVLNYINHTADIILKNLTSSIYENFYMCCKVYEIFSGALGLFLSKKKLSENAHFKKWTMFCKQNFR